MRRTFAFWLIVGFLAIKAPCQAQRDIVIPTPEVSLRDHQIRINYDILNSEPSWDFVVELEIRDEDGHLLPANALDGDVGPGVSGGMHKTIYWDLEQDRILMDGDILINVYAERTAMHPGRILSYRRHHLNRVLPRFALTGPL